MLVFEHLNMTIMLWKQVVRFQKIRGYLLTLATESRKDYEDCKSKERNDIVLYDGLHIH